MHRATQSNDAFKSLRMYAAVTAWCALQVDEVLGDRKPSVSDMGALRFTTRVINESMRLYPQPPVLIRRALEDDVVGGTGFVKNCIFQRYVNGFCTDNRTMLNNMHDVCFHATMVQHH